MEGNTLLPVIAAVAVAAASSGYNAMRPTASVGGAYGVMAQTDTPTPPPQPSTGCVDGCPCGGTGKEKSGDGIITFDCRCPDDCECKGRKSESCCDGEVAEEPPKMRKVYRMPGPRWNWEGLNNPSESFMRAHMMQDHGIDATGWGREAMQVGHDNIHNGHDVWGKEPAASAGNFRSDCPDGKCPLPAASSSGGGCPSGNCPTSSAGSSRRGLFGWRR